RMGRPLIPFSATNAARGRGATLQIRAIRDNRACNRYAFLPSSRPLDPWLLLPSGKPPLESVEDQVESEEEFEADSPLGILAAGGDSRCTGRPKKPQAEPRRPMPWSTPLNLRSDNRHESDWLRYRDGGGGNRTRVHRRTMRASTVLSGDGDSLGSLPPDGPRPELAPLCESRSAAEAFPVPAS